MSAHFMLMLFLQKQPLLTVYRKEVTLRGFWTVRVECLWRFVGAALEKGLWWALSYCTMTWRMSLEVARGYTLFIPVHPHSTSCGFVILSIGHSHTPFSLSMRCACLFFFRYPCPSSPFMLHCTYALFFSFAIRPLHVPILIVSVHALCMMFSFLLPTPWFVPCPFPCSFSLFIRYAWLFSSRYHTLARFHSPFLNSCTVHDFFYFSLPTLLRAPPLLFIVYVLCMLFLCFFFIATHALTRCHAPILHSCAVMYARTFFLSYPRPCTFPCPTFFSMRCIFLFTLHVPFLFFFAYALFKLYFSCPTHARASSHAHFLFIRHASVLSPSFATHTLALFYAPFLCSCSCLLAFFFLPVFRYSRPCTFPCFLSFLCYAFLSIFRSPWTRPQRDICSEDPWNFLLLLLRKPLYSLCTSHGVICFRLTFLTCSVGCTAAAGFRDSQLGCTVGGNYWKS